MNKLIGEFIEEPARATKVLSETDVCVIGGGCTGVFAAIRAARLGMHVILIERNGALGGTSVMGYVNIWHSLLDDTYSQQIIGGLTDEVERRMFKEERLEYVPHSPSIGARLDTPYLAFLLDRMCRENHVDVWFHSLYVGVSMKFPDYINAVLIENKDGRGAIKADFFIDCSGDGDVGRDLRISHYTFEKIQPPSECFLMTGRTDDEEVGQIIRDHGEEVGLDDDWGWNGSIPGLDDIYFRADNHVFGVNPASAKDLSYAEQEGRRRAYAFEFLLRKYGRQKHQVVAIAPSIGCRESVHYDSAYQVTEQDLLTGREFDDAILHGTYRIDIHHQDDNGITFKYLDGTVRTEYGKGTKTIISDWKKETGYTGPVKHWYSVPFRALVQNQVKNFIQAGRMINADNSAFGALRVMVNCNQLGEAAGVAASLCVDDNIPIFTLNGKEVQKKLNDGGSML